METVFVKVPKYICAMRSDKVRVRFAPSPTGGIHLGGVRTVLYNYLFARQHGGDFVLRIEDTDQSRYIPGAEEYIIECLNWCGLKPDEGSHIGGKFGPYRQSERKEIYRRYADKLVNDGYAYHAFDTPAELDEMRTKFRTESNPSPQYDSQIRKRMRNSLTLSTDEVSHLLKDATPFVIRIKMPEYEEIQFSDMIRGTVSFHTSLVDDKVLLKADGMPTYHLAVVVDDYMMQITHAFRGEEWLSSVPVHLLLWKYLGWENEMPQWAHLPLILKPDGHGKLSKRDGDLLGFPVFAMDWKDPKTGEMTKGFKELGFLPEAFVNMLAILGWNDGSGQEIFTLEELIRKFSIERVHKGGAKFDFEKAKWYNHEWIKRFEVEGLRFEVRKIFEEKGVTVTDDRFLDKVIGLVKDRCTLLTDFWDQGKFFFEAPNEFDLASVKPKWNEQKKAFFNDLIHELRAMSEWGSVQVEHVFKKLAEERNIKPGELQLPLRIMLVGEKFGPPVMEIAALIGSDETIRRIESALTAFN